MGAAFRKRLPGRGAHLYGVRAASSVPAHDSRVSSQEPCLEVILGMQEGRFCQSPSFSQPPWVVPSGRAWHQPGGQPRVRCLPACSRFAGYNIHPRSGVRPWSRPFAIDAD